jgi:putative restriction endonuclease
MVNLFVANTDNAWFDFLSFEQNVSEMNFWWPGELAFRAIQPGELLVFRLKSPRNKIGGFGVFSSHSRLPIQLAWERLVAQTESHRSNHYVARSRRIETTLLSDR